MKARVFAVIGIVAVITMIGSCQWWPYRDSLVYFTDDEVFVYDETLPSASVASTFAARAGHGRHKVENFEYRIFRTAQAMPVEVAGTQTQANDVVFSGNTAYVVYNTAGSQFAGAVQVIDLSNGKRPVVTAEIGLPDADVNAVAISGDSVYIAGAWDPDSATFPEYDAEEMDRAFVARILLDEIRSVTAADIADRKVILSGFAATGVAIKSDTVFVSTGALNGEIEILNSELEPVAQAAVTDRADFRDIETYHGGAIALQGTDQGEALPPLATGSILLVGQDGTVKDSVPIANFGSPEAKATIEVYDKHYAFLGLSEAGFQIVYLKDDDALQSLYTIDNPTVEWSDRTDTNSASYSGDLIFTANGEAGFRVFQVTGELKRDTPPDGDFTSLVGFVPFDETGPDAEGNYWSANHVEFQARDDVGSGVVGVLAVASGTGGLNIYYLSAK